MWTLVGFIVASVIGLATVLSAGRRGSIRRREYPWMLDAVSQLHVTIVGTLAGFAFTGVVLVVTLAHDRPGRAEISFDTVVVMFLVSYLYWVGSAFLISYLPHASTSGDLVQRVHFSLATTIEYRTVFLSWFALLPLLQANGLGRLVPVLYLLLPASLLLGSLVVAMTTDGLGLMMVKETYFSGAVGTGLALGLWERCGVRASRNALTLFLAVSRARHILRQRHRLRAGCRNAARVAIRRRQTLLREIWTEAYHRGYAGDDGFTSISLASRGRSHLASVHESVPDGSVVEYRVRCRSTSGLRFDRHLHGKFPQLRTERFPDTSRQRRRLGSLQFARAESAIRVRRTMPPDAS